MSYDEALLDGVALLQTALQLNMTEEGSRRCSGNCSRGAVADPVASLLSVVTTALAAAERGSKTNVLVTWAVTFVVGCCSFLLVLGFYWASSAAGAPPKGAPAAERRAPEYSLPLLFGRVVTAMVSLTEGYDLVVISGALAPLTKDLHVLEWQAAWVMGIQGFGMAFGAPIGGWMSDNMGRLPALMLGNAVMIVGALLIAVSGGFEVLLLGRIVQALGMGASLSISTAYNTEIAPAAIRGQLPSLEELFITGGMIFAFVTNYVLASVPEGWRLMFGLGATLPAISLTLLLLGIAVESPRYLMLRGRQEEAEATLRSLVDSEEAEDTMKKWSSELSSPAVATWARTVCPEDPLVRRAFFVGVGAMCLQMLSGANLLSGYAATVLAEEVGQHTSNLSMLLTAISRTLVSIPSVFLIDVVGRRPMLLTSVTLTTAAFCLLAGLYLAEGHVLPWKFAAFLLFFQTYSPGLGCVVYVYLGEVMDNLVRSKGVSTAIFVARILTSIEVLAFPAVRDHLGEGATFGILAFINFLGWLFIFFCAPETKGVQLENIGRCFDDAPEDT